MAPIKGICMQMCPEEEIIMRKSQKLIHQLECEPHKMVKSFSRSAAGRALNKPHLLRPPSILKKTVFYLLNNVLADTSVPFNCVYDFIDDRLNAVRQDATIQELSDQDLIEILPPIIRFHAFAAYKCYEYDINTFDPFLNMKHFHECIYKTVKILENKSTNDLFSEMVSLLIVANIGDYSVLQQTLPFLVKKNHLVKKAMKLSVNIMNGNFGELFKTYNEFPKVHQCVICVQLPIIRKYILKSMCLGFNCKKNYFPISILTKIMLHNNDQDTKKECKHYCITVIDNNAELSKVSFNNEVDELHLKKTIEFDANLSTIILNSISEETHIPSDL